MSGKKIRKAMRKVFEEMNEKRRILQKRESASCLVFLGIVIVALGFVCIWTGFTATTVPDGAFANSMVKEEWVPYHIATVSGFTGCFAVVFGFLFIISGIMLYIKYDRIADSKGYNREE